MALFLGLGISPVLALGMDRAGLLAVVAGLLKVVGAQLVIVLEVGRVVLEADTLVCCV